MSLTAGMRRRPYEIVAPLGPGGISVSSRWGWGPSASEKRMSPCRS